jgi:outer membrane protein TolC
MKLTKYIALLSLLTAACLPPAAEAVPLTFEEVMQQAGNRPAVLAGWDNAAAASHAASAEARANFLPGIGGQAEIRERNESLYTVTPFGDFPYGRDRIRSAGVQLVQPILNPARLFGTTPALRREASSQQRAALRAEQKFAAAAGEAFIDVLVIDARLGAVRAYVESLAGRLREIEAMRDAGRVLASDALKVQLALDAARQEELALDKRRDVAAYALGAAAGMDEKVEPAGDLTISPAGPAAAYASSGNPDIAVLIDAALNSRPDLQALAEQQRALGDRKRGVLAEALPRVEAQLSWYWTDADITAPRDWGEGALVLTWNPFASGSRFPRAEVYEARARALKRRTIEARRGIELEIRAAAAGLETARAALEVGARGVAQAEEALRVERERYEAARATANDLLDAEAALKDKTAERDAAALEIQRSILRLNTALGIVN